MTYHVPRRHPVAFETRTPGKSESVYYNLQFWLFLEHFWTFPNLVVFYPETFLGKPTWLLTLCGCFAPFVLPRKVSKHPIYSFLVKPKIASKRTYMHPYIHSKPHDSFPDTSHSPRRHPVTFELMPRESPKTCIVTFNLSCFWDIFWLLQAWLYFLPKPFLGVPMWIATLERWHNLHCLKKPLLPHLFISRETQISSNERKGIHIIV